MLVRVVALHSFDPSRELAAMCGSPSQDAPPEFGDVVLWQECGPNGDGDVALTIKVELSPDEEYGGACAYVTLADRKREDPSDDRAVHAYLRLADLNDASPTSEPD